MNCLYLRFVAVVPALLAIGACADTPGEISRDSQPFDGIAPSATITALGTEPFWDLKITPSDAGYEARYSTPEQLEGSAFRVTRFAGNNGLGFSGQLEGRAVNLALTPGECSDAMSDRTYPYTATLLMGETTLYGCAYTDLEPFTEGETVP